MENEKQKKIVVTEIALWDLLRRSMSRYYFYENYQVSMKLTSQLLAEKKIKDERSWNRVLTELEVKNLI